MADITISSRVRSNLLALQNTSDLMTLTQGRLATGKKVNSALDNPTAYFTAQGLSDRSSKLTNLLDGMNNGVSTVQAASKGLDSIYKQLQALQSLIQSVQSANTTGTNSSVGATGGLTTSTALTATGAAADTITIHNTTNSGVSDITVSLTGAKTVGDVINAINAQGKGAYTAKLDSTGALSIDSASADNFTVTGAGIVGANFGTFGANTAYSNTNLTASQLDNFKSQFNNIVGSIDQFAQDSGFNGVNLLQSGNTLTVNYNETGSSKTTIAGQQFDAAALGVAQISGTATVGSFTASAVQSAISTALTTVRAQQQSFSSSLAIMQNREDFTKSMANILQTGSDNLTNADMNQESANLLALQTRQQLSQTALSLSNQADQAVLRLFG